MTLFFMHITKTAGGSLKEALRQSDADVVFHYRSDEGFRRDFKYEHQPEIIFGHYIFGVHKRMGLPPNYACFMREPIARTISHYHHLKNNDRSPIGDRVRAYDGIETYLQHGKHWEFDNFLCRLISGTGNQPKFGEVGFNVYDAARRNLKEHFRFIGIFEDMGSSLDRLRKIAPSLGLDLPTVNKGAYSKELPEGTLRAVRELNRMDQLLYEDAVELAKSG